MKLAISHIAWSPEEDAEAYAILREQGVEVLEIAPGRWLPDPSFASIVQTKAARERARAEGFTIGAFQAILFGQSELRLFESERVRLFLLEYLRGIVLTAAACGVGPLVFGAPQQRRKPDGMSEPEADAVAVPFFRALAHFAATRGVCFCIEPNPEVYGTNFLNNAAEAARLVRQVDSPGLRLQIDAGELAMNREDVREVVREHADLIGHVHVSQAMLANFEEPWPGHPLLAEELANVGYQGLFSVEMKRGAGGLADVRQALEFARSCYGRD